MRNHRILLIACALTCVCALVMTVASGLRVAEGSSVETHSLADGGTVSLSVRGDLTTKIYILCAPGTNLDNFTLDGLPCHPELVGTDRDGNLIVSISAKMLAAAALTQAVNAQDEATRTDLEQGILDAFGSLLGGTGNSQNQTASATDLNRTLRVGAGGGDTLTLGVYGLQKQAARIRLSQLASISDLENNGGAAPGGRNGNFLTNGGFGGGNTTSLIFEQEAAAALLAGRSFTLSDGNGHKLIIKITAVQIVRKAAPEKPRGHGSGTDIPQNYQNNGLTDDQDGSDSEGSDSEGPDSEDPGPEDPGPEDINMN